MELKPGSKLGPYEIVSPIGATDSVGAGCEVAVPGATPVTSPVTLTVAAAVFEELQFTWLVMFCVLPSL